MSVYGFDEQLGFSMSSSQLETDREIIMHTFPNVVDVKQADVKQDKSGVDYIATLDSGVVVTFDMKTRSKLKYPLRDKKNPYLAIETWSQWWGKKEPRNVPGWTYDPRKKCDFITYKFDKEDTDCVFTFAFQQLRKASIIHYKEWLNKYREHTQEQKTAGYVSKCFLIPANVIVKAVSDTFISTVH